MTHEQIEKRLKKLEDLQDRVESLNELSRANNRMMMAWGRGMMEADARLDKLEASSETVRAGSDEAIRRDFGEEGVRLMEETEDDESDATRLCRIERQNKALMEEVQILRGARRVPGNVLWSQRMTGAEAAEYSVGVQDQVMPQDYYRLVLVEEYDQPNDPDYDKTEDTEEPVVTYPRVTGTEGAWYAEIGSRRMGPFTTPEEAFVSVKEKTNDATTRMMGALEAALGYPVREPGSQWLPSEEGQNVWCWGSAPGPRVLVWERGDEGDGYYIRRDADMKLLCIPEYTLPSDYAELLRPLLAADPLGERVTIGEAIRRSHEHADRVDAGLLREAERDAAEADYSDKEFAAIVSVDKEEDAYYPLLDSSLRPSVAVKMDEWRQRIIDLENEIAELRTRADEQEDSIGGPVVVDATPDYPRRERLSIPPEIVAKFSFFQPEQIRSSDDDDDDKEPSNPGPGPRVMWSRVMSSLEVWNTVKPARWGLMMHQDRRYRVTVTEEPEDG